MITTIFTVRAHRLQLVVTALSTNMLTTIFTVRAHRLQLVVTSLFTNRFTTIFTVRGRRLQLVVTALFVNMFTTIITVRAHRLQLMVTALSKAFNHAKEMETEAQCGVPKPRLVCMRDVSSVANKDYFPRCTVVHQCSPSVGCCNASSECSPVNTTIITRHFLVSVHQLLLSLMI